MNRDSYVIDGDLLGLPGKPESVTRWVVTHINADGDRVMSLPRQGKNTHGAKNDAEQYMSLMLYNLSTSIAVAYGKQALGTFEVRPVECWPHTYDPKQFIFD